MLQLTQPFLYTVCLLNLQFVDPVFSHLSTELVNECEDYTVCGSLGRHPCGHYPSEEEADAQAQSCGPCINGFVEMSDNSRVCRRIKPSDRKSQSTLLIDDFKMDKRAYANQNPMYLSSSQDKSFKAVANRHTITFLILISLAVAGVLLVGILGLVYHKYSKKELKASFPSRSGSNRKVSYGFEGADDMEEKELARKTQIYHYQHQKRMMASMESRRSNQNSAGSDLDGGKVIDGAALESRGMEPLGSDDALLLDKAQSSNEQINQAGASQSSGGSGTISGLKNSLLRMRSQGSVGCSSGQTHKEQSGSLRSKGHQHHSLDRATPPSSTNYKSGRVGSPEKVGEENDISGDQQPQQAVVRGRQAPGAGEESEGELGVDYTVYECPGLAPSGEMVVKNPLFSNGDYGDANATDEEEEEEEE